MARNQNPKIGSRAGQSFLRNLQAQRMAAVSSFSANLVTIACKCRTNPLQQRRTVSNYIGKTKNQTLVVCSLRDGSRPRPTLWRGRVLTGEAIQAVQSLKRAANFRPHKLEHVFRDKVSRLVKTDLLAVLTELQRQNQCDLALQVFEMVRKEIWYQPDACLYGEMMMTLARNGLVEQVERLFSQLNEEGLEPDARVCSELMGAYIRAGMMDKAITVYEMMKMEVQSKPNELTYAILHRALQKNELADYADQVKKDAQEFLPESAEILSRFSQKTDAS